jgi:hypothetical protein
MRCSFLVHQSHFFENAGLIYLQGLRSSGIKRERDAYDFKQQKGLTFS